MKAIILAAGKGTRISEITNSIPKTLLKIGSLSIIERLIYQLEKNGIEEIIVVTGYKSDILQNYLNKFQNVRFIKYNNFNNTNNLHTLWSVNNEIKDNIIVSFADLLLENKIITSLIESEGDIVMATDNSNILPDTMRVSCERTNLKSITLTPVDEATGNFIGIAKFNKNGCKILKHYMRQLVKDGHSKDYYTVAVNEYLNDGGNAVALNVNGLKWIEIDNAENYLNAKKIFEKIL